MEFYYNFNTKQQVNPLEGITHFFVNAYMMASFKLLGLGDKLAGIDVELSIQSSTGLPIVIIPIEVLQLENVHVKMTDNGFILTKRIEFGKQTIYIKFTDMKHIVRVDSVLY